jgi:hypothetical protein
MGRFDALTQLDTKQEPQAGVSPSRHERTRDEKPSLEAPPAQSPKLGHAIPDRSPVRSPDRPIGKRIITRNAFEIYEDQIDALRQLSYEEKIEGKPGSMSSMVREAIDEYLRKRKSTL